MTDRSLKNRLERLEADQTVARTRIVWIEPDEAWAEALMRVPSLEPDEAPVFVGWQGADRGQEMGSFRRF
jgi:hypothetical protein